MPSSPRATTATAITGAGVWHPDHVLDNAKLCVAFNEFVRRENAKYASGLVWFGAGYSFNSLLLQRT